MYVTAAPSGTSTKTDPGESSTRIEKACAKVAGGSASHLEFWLRMDIGAGDPIIQDPK
jgi:hypothetical protein